LLETYHTQAKRKLVATLVSLIIIAGVVVYIDHSKALSSSNTAGTTSTSQTATTSTPSTSSNSSSDSSSSTITPDSSTNSTSTGSSSSSYKDGTYSATADYYVPHGDETIAVSLTIQNGLITNASIQNSEGDRESAQFQENFATSYKSYVVGKSISGLRLSVVSGASDTTQGFNDALTQIATEAQS
jgi:uncharacterized protein with FMN-binding domain